MTPTDDQLAALRERIGMTFPLLATFVAWWLPVFDVVVVSDSDSRFASSSEDVVPVGTSTLVGAIFDGDAEPSGLVRIVAIVVVALLAATALTTGAWLEARRARTGSVLDALALAALVAVVVLWFAVRADDSRTVGLGLEPTMQYVALLVAAAAYPLARGRGQR